MLTTSLHRFVGWGETCAVFEDSDQARAYAQAVIAQNPALECIITSAAGSALRLSN